MKKLTWTIVSMALLATSLQAATLKMGVVDFKEAVEKSQKGEQERSSFEGLKEQMMKALEESDKELNAMAKKLEDEDYMESLSATTQKELQEKFQMKSQEMARFQNQYYQMLQQANYRMLQNLHTAVAEASDKVREEHDLELILNLDAVFSYDASLDLTDEVIKVMDAGVDTDAKE